MCSTPGDPETPRDLETPDDLDRPRDLDRLGRAIDELADATQGRDVTTGDVATRLARVWDMVADLDPELARRLAGYGN
jgi:hypothetical protein